MLQVLPGRRNQTAAARRLPDLIASEKPSAARDVVRLGRLLAFVSRRLTRLSGFASCLDFTRSVPPPPQRVARVRNTAAGR
jgi:hypothetical protein